MSISSSTPSGGLTTPPSPPQVMLANRSLSGSSRTASREYLHMSPAIQVNSLMGANCNSTQVTLTETNKLSQDAFKSQHDLQGPSANRRDTGVTLTATMSPSPTTPTLSSTSTLKPEMTLTSRMEKLSTSRVTAVKAEATAEQSPSALQRMQGSLKIWYNRFLLQFSMIGLAFMGFFTALAHHLYNASLSGKEVLGDAQWPPRYGSVLAFFVRLVLVASVQIAYKQQAWVSQIYDFENY